MQQRETSLCVYWKWHQMVNLTTFLRNHVAVKTMARVVDICSNGVLLQRHKKHLFMSLVTILLFFLIKCFNKKYTVYYFFIHCRGQLFLLSIDNFSVQKKSQAYFYYLLIISWSVYILTVICWCVVVQCYSVSQLVLGTLNKIVLHWFLRYLESIIVE